MSADPVSEGAAIAVQLVARATVTPATISATSATMRHPQPHAGPQPAPRARRALTRYRAARTCDRMPASRLVAW